MQNPKTVENYIMPLGKYKGMYIKDILHLKTVNKKGEEVDTGRYYLDWLTKPEQSWFRDVDLINKLLGKEDPKPKPTPKKTYKKNATNEIMEEVIKVDSQ